MTYDAVFRRGRETLADFPPMEAHLLFEAAGGLGREALPLRGEEACPDTVAEAFERLCARRIGGEPLQYLLGEWEFLGLPFFVGPGVLIPRPETELLAEALIGALRGMPEPLALDLCSGSGCIAVAAAHALPYAEVWAVELSLGAYPYLEKNIRRNGCANLHPILGDALHPPETVGCRRYDAIACNPPYVSASEMETLQTEVRQEPVSALLGGEDGLDYYRALPTVCAPLLKKDGLLLLEIGDTQAEAVCGLLREADYREVTLIKDYAGKDRLVTAKAPNREPGV